MPERLRKLPSAHPASWQRVLLNELRHNPAVKIHVVILRKQFERSESFTHDEVSFHLLKAPALLRAPSLFWVDTLLIGRALRRIQPDLVHAWGTERAAALVASRLSYPYLVTIQGLMTWLASQIKMSRYHRLATWLEKLSLPRAPLVTTESAFAVQFLKERWPHLRLMQVEHAPNWVFHQVQRRPQTQPVRFVFVGTFRHSKGADLLFKALDQIKDELSFEMVIVGNCESGLMGTLRGNASRELWSRVRFRLDLPTEQVAEELAVATVMLYPTRADTSPNAVKEAVVAGVPVVASAVGGIVDYVFPGANGFTFPSEDVPAFVQAIRDACRHPLFGKGLVEPEALQKTREYLSPKRMGERFLDAYQALGIPARPT
jgi:glycosyltransferase involved in cell wall biosynthesis